MTDVQVTPTEVWTEGTLSDICICGHPRRRHHPPAQRYGHTCAECACIYFETAPIDPERPIEAQLADAIRCTAHIEDRILRARYVLTDLKLRGILVERVQRDARGRFVGSAVPA